MPLLIPSEEGVDAVWWPARRCGVHRHTKRIRGGKWHLRRLLRQRPSLRFQAYDQQVRALFQAIRAVSGKRVVEDTTKTPSRALVLSMISGVDVRILHLVRDGRGVAWSMEKRPS